MAKSIKTMQGNVAAAYVSYAFTEAAAIYPISPISSAAEIVDEWVSEDRKNIFGDPVVIREMESEAGAAGAVHGMLESGTLATTYTASQGLLLMIPNLYKIAAERLPGVFHVASRTIATHALSILGDHSDVMAVRQTGMAILASNSLQEIADLTAVAHASAIKAQHPFLHFFDGFTISYEIKKAELLDYADYADMIDQDSLAEFRSRAMTPEHPNTRGTAQNPDIFFQMRETVNSHYEEIPDIVEHYMQVIKDKTGREYHPFTYYGDPDAENVIVAIGSVVDTTATVIDYLRKQGKKVGVISVHLYRPFSLKYLFKVMPKTVKAIAVLDRTKEPGATGEPLYLDIRDAFYGKENAPIIVGGRYGLSTKDPGPRDILAVYQNLEMAEPKNHFTISIVDDVTFTSLTPVAIEGEFNEHKMFQGKFFGIGSDGMVSASKNSIKIIGDNTDKRVQARIMYDSKKSGGYTVCDLRFSDYEIKAPYPIRRADFISCAVTKYVRDIDILQGLRKHGTLLLNTLFDEKEIIEYLPNHVKRYLAENEINFYIINAYQQAKDIGLGSRINTIMQAAFFKLVSIIPYEDAEKYMKDLIKKTYMRKGEEIVKLNYQAVDIGANSAVQIKVDPNWKNLKDEVLDKTQKTVPDFVKEIAKPMLRLEGDKLPVSAFMEYTTGIMPNGTSQYEKRGVAPQVPHWEKENCIECNQCAYVCPHAVIRPKLISTDEKQEIGNLETLKAIGPQVADYDFYLSISPLDCTGCGNCAWVCPGKRDKQTGEIKKALMMEPFETQLKEADTFELLEEKVTYKDFLDKKIFKNSQFRKPYFEFHGACPGCGETPYLTVLSRMYGDRMFIANATGCSSIYGGSYPSAPYTKDENGYGPAWANSLFEDNAQFGVGMLVADQAMKNRILRILDEISKEVSSETQKAIIDWTENIHMGEGTRERAHVLLDLLSKEKKNAKINELLKIKQFFIKPSFWMIGGDGWSYDIGFGGLDHALSTHLDFNVLIMDTEVYSNTGGQASKSTPLGAIAKFAAGGMGDPKKDIGLMMTDYGHVYVARVAMGANMAHYHKVLQEAESYNGPSLIIAYAPCIEHGIIGGMGHAQEEEKLAVATGYWPLWTYDPRRKEAGENPFKMNCKKPTEPIEKLLMNEMRYKNLLKKNPTHVKEIFARIQKDIDDKYKFLEKLAEI